jgi:hypothetical protein
MKFGNAEPMRRMSALGQKQTCAVQNGGATRHVRFVPIADVVGHLQRPNERDQISVYVGNRTNKGWDFLHYC